MDDRGHQTIIWLKRSGWLLAGLAILFVVRWLWQIDRAAWIQLWHLKWPWLVLATIILWGWFLLRFLAWHIISRSHGYQTGRRKNLRMWMISELLRYVPGNIWSFMRRWQGSVEGGSTPGSAGQAVMIEALAQTSGAGLVAAWYLPWPWSGLVFSSVLVMYFSINTLLAWLWKKWRKHDLPPHLSITELLRLIFLYVASWVVFGIASAALYQAFTGLPQISWVFLTVTNVMAWLIGYLSIVTPMGLGVREVTFVGLVRDYLAAPLAGLVSLVTRLWMVIAEIILLGAVMLFFKNNESH